MLHRGPMVLHGNHILLCMENVVDILRATPSAAGPCNPDDRTSAIRNVEKEYRKTGENYGLFLLGLNGQKDKNNWIWG